MLEARLQGTRAGAVRGEFLANSAYFPLANIFFEVLREGWGRFAASPDPYTLLAAGCVQATWGPAVWRATFGPALRAMPRPTYANAWGAGPSLGERWALDVVPTPNVELAFPVGEGGELAFGGYSLIAWRTRW